MLTLKGPFKIKMKGKTISEALSPIVSKELGNSPLPFKADNWKSEKNYDKVSGGKPLLKIDEVKENKVIILAEAVKSKPIPTPGISKVSGNLKPVKGVKK